MKLSMFMGCLVGMFTISHSIQRDSPTISAATGTPPVPILRSSHLRCAQFKDMALEDRFRLAAGKERVFAKYCTPTSQTLMDNYCQCNVVPRTVGDTQAFVDKLSARSFLNRRASTRALNEECCNEGCNLEEIVELAKTMCSS